MEPRVDAEERERMVAEAAYFRAERRGFTGGDPVADWVEAEAEVDAALSAQSGGLQVQSAALYEHPAESRGGEASGGDERRSVEASGGGEPRSVEAPGGGEAGGDRHGKPPGGDSHAAAARGQRPSEPGSGGVPGQHSGRHGGESRGKGGEQTRASQGEPQGQHHRERHGQHHGERHGQDHGEQSGQHDGEQSGHHHDELLARIEDGVAEAAKKVEVLRKKAGDAETTVRAEVQQQLDRIAELREALETRRNEIRQQGAQASRTLLEQAESLWTELTAFLSRKAPATRKRSRRK